MYMRANEIMIGDIVNVWDSYIDDETGKVVRIYETPRPERICAVFKDVAQYDNGEDSYDVELFEIEPIPLTPEILEKNGFEHRRYEDAEYYCLADDYFDITVGVLSDSIWLARYDCTEMEMPFEQVACSYVHQLQHFLRLVAMDELADNFKV